MPYRSWFFRAVSVCFLIVACGHRAEEPSGDRYPGAVWEKAQTPEALGYLSERLAEARKYAEGIETAAVVIVSDGVIVDEWGAVDRKFMSHSIRKSFLSALYGKYVVQGLIDLDRTINDLGIEDNPPLSDLEKTATVRDCLKARSGVYHPAMYESPDMKGLKPARHTHRPGTYWYYNNWDFNVLGAIFEQETGRKIFEALKEDIADPIGMEHYEPEDGWYVTGEESVHPAYPFRMTARDMARFGLLMLRKGKWNGKQVIPAGWVEESTSYQSDAALYGSDGYGYMWWVAKKHNRFPHLPNVDVPEGTYSARGAGGHYLLIVPACDMIIVHRVDTDIAGNDVSPEEMGRLVRIILNAKTR